MTSNAAFNALADPTRRSILAMLREGEKTAGELAEAFDVTKPSMSHHFAVLKEADLITSRRQAQQIWYALNTSIVEELLNWTINLLSQPELKRRHK